MRIFLAALALAGAATLPHPAIACVIETPARMLEDGRADLDRQRELARSTARLSDSILVGEIVALVEPEQADQFASASIQVEYALKGDLSGRANFAWDSSSIVVSCDLSDSFLGGQPTVGQSHIVYIKDGRALRVALVERYFSWHGLSFDEEMLIAQLGKGP